jgi:hypothetical protein
MRHVACVGERIGLYRVMVVKREGKRREDNIKMQLQGGGIGVMDSIEQAQERDRWWLLVNAVMNLRVP